MTTLAAAARTRMQRKCSRAVGSASTLPNSNDPMGCVCSGEASTARGMIPGHKHLEAGPGPWGPAHPERRKRPECFGSVSAASSAQHQARAIQRPRPGVNARGPASMRASWHEARAARHPKRTAWHPARAARHEARGPASSSHFPTLSVSVCASLAGL